MEITDRSEFFPFFKLIGVSLRTVWYWKNKCYETDLYIGWIAAQKYAMRAKVADSGELCAKIDQRVQTAPRLIQTLNQADLQKVLKANRGLFLMAFTCVRSAATPFTLHINLGSCFSYLFPCCPEMTYQCYSEGVMHGKVKYRGEGSGQETSQGGYGA